jgi:hypothetical protein
MLMVSGQLLVEDDVLLTADEATLAADASRAARRLLERKAR